MNIENLYIKEIEEKEADEIIKWTYQAPYHFYNMSEEDKKELIENNYYTLMDDHGSLFGFFCIGKSARVPAGESFGVYTNDCFLDLDLGMNPRLVGQGYGSRFLNQILQFLNSQHHDSLRLTVASFNQRAIKVYIKSGFVEKYRFIRKTKNDDCEFIVMEFKQPI